ncbi:hypothetical protein [Salmonella enterica]|uniref:hypothetical protein n=1 Tax=Salmonella enterica TaxID=28901 RepID=UPI0009FF56BF|nr:hypothetical protein [Salmonella enterica]ORG45683.1 hypothetical protein B5Z83_16305 [Salmonella enterica subsp. enterica serovar Typhimurium]
MKKLKGVISAAVLSLYLLTPAHADGGFQGAIKGGIPAYTRDVKHNKPFWCNQYKLVRKMCEVVSQSENGRVAIVRMVPTDWKCPNGIWGVVDRSNGDAMELVPTAKMPLEQYCSKAFSAGFVKPQNRKSLADVVMYYNGKPVGSFEYIEE